MRRRIAWLFLILLPGTALLAQEAGPSEARSRPRYPSLTMMGFSDVNFFASDEENVDSSSGFQEGQFVLHFVSELAERFSFFGEVSLTARSSEYKAELERGIVKYERSDYLKVSFGRYHTPINWWNDAFHHGQWLQTTVSRPEMTRFGGEFIPVHFVGGQIEGAIPSGPVNLAWKGGLGNGRGDNIARAGDAGDNNNNRAWLVNLSARPDAPYGLEVGGAFYRDKISRDMAEDFRESITSGYVIWGGETPEVIAEYAHVDREGIDTGDTYQSSAYYLQAAWRLPVLKSRLKPYARYERINVASNEPVFVAQTDRTGYIGGVRWDASTLVAAKLELRRQRGDRDDWVNAVFTQLSIAF